MTSNDSGAPRFSPHQLVDVLTSGEGTLFAIVNGYRSPDILTLIHGQGCVVEPLSREQGDASIGPQLTEPSTELLRQLVNQGWGKRWGLYLRAEASLEELGQHFAELMTVTRANSTSPLRLPFYEPVIMRRFLMACTEHQTQAIFGPVSTFMIEHDRGGSVWCAAHDNPLGKVVSLSC